MHSCNNSWLNGSVNKPYMTHTVVLGISNYISRFNNFVKSTNISTFPLHNLLYIIRNMITYNLGKIINHIM